MDFAVSTLGVTTDTPSTEKLQIDWVPGLIESPGVNTLEVYWLERRPSVWEVVSLNPVQEAITPDESHVFSQTYFIIISGYARIL